ncbi:TetR/AcrR family transcriptional regulator [Nocardia colli]|uniref:TetR/AcrR family transcriptional regulator n=1 Tax=Nocardia colli TaxID=2545717 RepID=UPI0035D8435D
MSAGRPREFDEAAVLDAVAGRFRVHGFADTSTEQLCEAAGVRRSSLYNTFTSKNELFVRALERHTGVALEQQEAVLTDQRLPGAGRLAALFDLTLAEERAAERDGHAAGCMIVASRMAPDLGAKDPRVQRLLDRYADVQLTLLAGAVRAGQLDGTLRKDVAERDAALMISSAISGLRVLAQSGSRAAELRRVADLHLDSLRAGT